MYHCLYHRWPNRRGIIVWQLLSIHYCFTCIPLYVIVGYLSWSIAKNIVYKKKYTFGTLYGMYPSVDFTELAFATVSTCMCVHMTCICIPYLKYSVIDGSIYGMYRHMRALRKLHHCMCVREYRKNHWDTVYVYVFVGSLPPCYYFIYLIL